MQLDREECPFDSLVGRTIRGMSIAAADKLLFDTDAGFYVYEVEGDCCSSSWYSDVLNVEVLLGERVLSVAADELPEDFVMPQNNEETDEYFKVYGYTLKTQYGACNIIFRNSSNGYYGGDVLAPRFYERAEDVESAAWVAVTEDIEE